MAHMQLFLENIVKIHLHGLAKTGNAWQVLRARTKAAFLGSPIQQGCEVHPLFPEQRSCSFGSVHLVGAQREQVDA